MKEKRSLIPRGCTVPSLEMRRISCLAAIVATRIEMSGNRLVGIVGILGGGGGGRVRLAAFKHYLLLLKILVACSTVRRMQ